MFSPNLQAKSNYTTCLSIYSRVLFSINVSFAVEYRDPSYHFSIHFSVAKFFIVSSVGHNRYLFH